MASNNRNYSILVGIKLDTGDVQKQLDEIKGSEIKFKVSVSGKKELDETVKAQREAERAAEQAQREAEEAAKAAQKAEEEAYKKRLSEFEDYITEKERLEKRWVDKQKDLGLLSNNDYLYITQQTCYPC